jgi:hypothetical protein
MKIMFAAIVLFIACRSEGQPARIDSLLRDSSRTETTHKVVKRITTRFHSIGFFNFSGRICSSTPAVDLNLNYENNGYGVILFSAKDLIDNHSENNFSFGIVYKRILLTKRFSIIPNFGVVMDERSGAFGDRIFVTSSFKVSPKLTIDETSLFANLLKPEESKEWINRVRFIYSHTNHIQLVVSNWHNNSIFDRAGYLSGAFQASYNRIALSDHVYLQTAVSFFVMAKNTDEVPYREKNGILFTMGFNFE